MYVCPRGRMQMAGQQEKLALDDFEIEFGERYVPAREIVEILKFDPSDCEVTLADGVLKIRSESHRSSLYTGEWRRVQKIEKAL